MHRGFELLRQGQKNWKPKHRDMDLNSLLTGVLLVRFLFLSKLLSLYGDFILNIGTRVRLCKSVITVPNCRLHLQKFAKKLYI